MYGNIFLAVPHADRVGRVIRGFRPRIGARMAPISRTHPPAGGWPLLPLTGRFLQDPVYNWEFSSFRVKVVII
jgi:hypothetical protein